ncbi:hypothetical protein B0H14DRAFT_3861129 [Mycena olivaceomarginata]|nr:hypothetical protein B0H14DRAFT_3861129 [Mycena olivaceomarginata]
MSSLDGSMNVYPIQLTPLDWFAGLSTSFTLEDLTQDPEVIQMQINAKSQEIDTLNAQLVALEMGGKGDPTALQNKVQAAVIAMANTCLDAFGKLDTGALAEKLQVAKDVLADLPAMMETVQEAQNNLTASSRAQSQLMAAQALAEASDTKQQQQQIEIQLQSFQRDLKELQTRWQVLTSSTGGVTPPSAVDHGDQDVPTTPIQLPEESTSGNRSRLQIEQWSCKLWFASGSGSSTTSTGGTISSNAATEDTIDLAFRATLVTVDRGGWFQPQFFKESKAFYKVNPDITWTDATPQTIGDILKGKGQAKGLMPGFPIAFLLAKDIVVRINHGANASADSKQTDAASAASSGGFLCFLYSNSRPQILGYMIQVLDSDQPQFMPNEPPAGFFIPDDEYDNTVTGPSQSIDPGGPKQPAAPAITQEKLREVLDKMLNDKIGELFDQLTPAGPST